MKPINPKGGDASPMFVRLTQEQWDWLREWKGDSDVSLAQLVRQCIDEAMASAAATAVEDGAE